ncbi:hypothetical protein WMY93_031950 [Mugilogobius chulae]|uniref:Ig-like domain-containing protein n=1 Tax=Mugilogobius chulae TaxID=88201 RepID=A0AAW0MKQ0_9GOBI
MRERGERMRRREEERRGMREREEEERMRKERGMRRESYEERVNTTVTEGEDCEMPCFISKDIEVIALMWTVDVNKDLLIYRRGQLMEDDIDPEFKGRVHLKDSSLKNGDMSVILSNVTTNDNGIYECLVQNKDEQNHLQLIHLIVQQHSHSTHQPFVTYRPETAADNANDDIQEETESVFLQKDLLTPVPRAVLVVVEARLNSGVGLPRHQQRKKKYPGWPQDLDRPRAKIKQLSVR